MNQDKMRRCWPAGSSEIIGARMDINRREQQPFTLPRHKLSRRKEDRYGSDTPVPSLPAKIISAIKTQLSDRDNLIEGAVTLGIAAVIALCLFTFLKVLPGAVDGLSEHSRQVVAESRK